MRLCLLVLTTLYLHISICTAQTGSSTRENNWTPPIIIKGKVIDSETGQGLEFATVSIYSKSDGVISGGGLTEIGGLFSFKSDKLDIYAVIEFISYKSHTIDHIEISAGSQIIDLGEILLSPDAVQLEDVEIVAERSETTFSLDKKVFTVDKDLANRGGNAEDVLNNVPSLDVDIEGNISLRGSQGVRVLIDGRPSSLVGVNDGSGLRSLPSNLIDKIEVITNPSARYDAEGMAGIINIVLKKNTGGGFNGAIDVSGGLPTNAGLSANLNYRKNNLNWFVNYGINYRTGPGGGNTIQDRLTNNESGNNLERQLTIQNRDMSRGGLSNSIRFGADYYFSDKDQLTGSFNYKYSDNNNVADLLFQDYSDALGNFNFEPLWQNIDDSQFFDFDDFENDIPNELLQLTTFRRDDEKEIESALQYDLNYSKELSSREHKLNASISFRDRLETERNIFTETQTSFNAQEVTLNQRGDVREDYTTLELQLDYVHPLGKDHKYEVGLKSSLRDIRTNYLVEQADANGFYSALPGLDNAFNYDEDVFATYGIYGNRLNDISFQFGLRSEYSLINTILVSSQDVPENKRDFFNLFPSGHVSYHLNDTDALQISYSRRIRRPRFWDLNPFFTFQDSRNFFSGNPNLNPQFTDSYEIGSIKYWEDVSLSSSLFYRRTASSIQRLITIDNTSFSTFRIPVNVGTTDDYGLDITASYTALKWLRLNFNTNIFRNQLSVNQEDVAQEVFRYYRDVQDNPDDFQAFEDRYNFNLQETDNITWNARMTSRFTFFDSDLQLRLNYRGPRQSAQGESRPITSVDLGWSKDLLEKKNLSVTLSIRDLFNSRRRAGSVFLDDFFQQSEFQWRSRTGTVTLSYRINQKKKQRGKRGSSGAFDGGGESF